MPSPIKLSKSLILCLITYFKQFSHNLLELPIIPMPGRNVLRQSYAAPRQKHDARINLLSFSVKPTNRLKN